MCTFFGFHPSSHFYNSSITLPPFRHCWRIQYLISNNPTIQTSYRPNKNFFTPPTRWITEVSTIANPKKTELQKLRNTQQTAKTGYRGSIVSNEMAFTLTFNFKLYHVRISPQIYSFINYPSLWHSGNKGKTGVFIERQASQVKCQSVS